MGYYEDGHKRLEYSAIRQLLEGLASRYGWTPIMEGTYIIGVEKDGQSVTIEPGGQFELSGAPLASLHDTAAETQAHLDQVRTGDDAPDAAYVGAAEQPVHAGTSSDMALMRQVLCS